MISSVSNPPPTRFYLHLSVLALVVGLEYILRVLQVKKIPFTSYDMASDEDAKKLWRRKAPLCECRRFLSPYPPLGLIVESIVDRTFGCYVISETAAAWVAHWGRVSGGLRRIVRLSSSHLRASTPVLPVPDQNLTNATRQRRGRRMRRTRYVPPSQRRMGRRALRPV